MYPVDYPAAEGSVFSSVSEDCMVVLGSDYLHGQARFQPPQASKVTHQVHTQIAVERFSLHCTTLLLHSIVYIVLYSIAYYGII